MAESRAQRSGAGRLWPDALTMPPSWVVWSIFLAIRFRLAEIAVPPGGALLEKLAALAPGATDALLRRATDAPLPQPRAARNNAVPTGDPR